MAKQSAGLLLYRIRDMELWVFLVHPGGPFFANKDMGVWSIPKGEFAEEEDALTAAKREFKEETGLSINGEFIPLDPIKQKGGKIVYAWALEADIDVGDVHSNTFTIKWPPNSGNIHTYPEVDKAEWFTLPVARQKINAAQVAFLDQLEDLLAT